MWIDRMLGRDGPLLLCAGLATGVIVLITTADVVSRYLFNHPIDGVLEFTEVALLIMTVFLALPAVDHIRIDLLHRKFPADWRSRIDISMNSTVLILLLLAGIATFERGLFSAQTDESTTGITTFLLYPWRFVASAGFFAAALRMAVLVVQALFSVPVNNNFGGKEHEDEFV